MIITVALLVGFAGGQLTSTLLMADRSWLSAFLGHNLIAGVVAAAIQVAGAFVLFKYFTARLDQSRAKQTERWERRRQRRDFQYRVATTLASVSGLLLKVLREALAMHTHRYNRERHEELRREYAVQLVPLLALDFDFFATFEEENLMGDFAHLTGVLNAAHGVLLGGIGGLDVIGQDLGRALLKCATAQRRLMLTQMSQEMGLMRPSDDLRQRLERQARDLPPEITIAPLDDV